MSMSIDGSWDEDLGADDDETDDIGIDRYDLTSTPNDFNVKTIVDFIERGVFEVPGFQRNYVWDIRRASKLIESLIMGLPVPQVFLFDQGKNKFLVIDGQQRLLTIYAFVKKRFPRMDKRAALGKVLRDYKKIPSDILDNDELFEDFKLMLPSKLPKNKNPLHGLDYDTLGESQMTFDLRTIRCMFIKQAQPSEDDSSVYEIFNRLNTGGISLTPQEIRTSLFHSEFYNKLYELNTRHEWRKLIGSPEPELHLRDVEILLRGFAMLVMGDQYQPSMTRFLNKFSKSMRNKTPDELNHMESIFLSFLEATKDLPEDIFGSRSRKLSISVFESIFAAACTSMYLRKATKVSALNIRAIEALKGDKEFIEASSTKSTNKNKVEIRLSKARAIFGGSGASTHAG